MHKSYLCSADNLLIISAHDCSLANDEASRPIYSEIDLSSKLSICTHLLVCPSNMSKVNTFSSSYRPIVSRKKNCRANQGSRIKKQLAKKLHGYSHLAERDMKTMCEPAKNLSPSMEEALKGAFEKRSSCTSTGLPLQSRTISFSRIIAEFNDNLQVDFLFVIETSDFPILHTVDSDIGYSETSAIPSRQRE